MTSAVPPPACRLLLLSNSRNPGLGYLDHARVALEEFLGPAPRRLVFIPWAAVTFSWEEYLARVDAVFRPMGHAIQSLHRGDPAALLAEAEGIVVGGGNTFRLTRQVRQTGVVELIRDRVAAGIPYIGWSAGSNLACPTISTTNDMPIVEPLSLEALGLVPFQINPHYTDRKLAGHGGESRDERLAEFLALNPGATVVGLREGSWLERLGPSLVLGGPHPLRLFRHGLPPQELPAGTALDVLLEEGGSPR